jgi:hypothetical protein
LNDNPSNTKTATLLEKRAVVEDDFQSPMSQPSSPLTMGSPWFSVLVSLSTSRSNKFRTQLGVLLSTTARRLTTISGAK